LERKSKSVQSHATIFDCTKSVNYLPRRNIAGESGGKRFTPARHDLSSNPVLMVSDLICQTYDKCRLFSATRRRGAATVELALSVSLLLFPMTVGLLEVGRLSEVQMIMNNAVREGARQGCAGQMTDTQCISVVRLYLSNEGLPITNANVTVTNLGFPGNPTPVNNNPQNATDLDQIQVTLTLPYADVSWFNLHLATTSTTVMSATATWSSCKDRAYPVPVPPPGF
jgi:Flp pilus assembly protein TadG